MKSELNWIWIQVACNVIQYFHSNGAWFLENQFIFFMSWSSMVVHNKMEPKFDEMDREV